jgi:hypothetical protein
MARSKRETKHDVKYLYARYIKFYNKADMDKASEYHDLAMKLHGVDLAQRYHMKIEKREQSKGTFGLGKTKRLRYG